jgi:hypothetical protein
VSRVVLDTSALLFWTLAARGTGVVLASFPVLAYDEPAAHWQGHERARLEGLGRPAPYVDGQIAAIARVNDLDLAVVLHIGREIHRGHAAGAELAFDGVAAGERGGEAVNRGGHRHNVRRESRFV